MSPLSVQQQRWVHGDGIHPRTRSTAYKVDRAPPVTGTTVEASIERAPDANPDDEIFRFVVRLAQFAESRLFVVGHPRQEHYAVQWPRFRRRICRLQLLEDGRKSDVARRRCRKWVTPLPLGCESQRLVRSVRPWRDDAWIVIATTGSSGESCQRSARRYSPIERGRWRASQTRLRQCRFPTVSHVACVERTLENATRDSCRAKCSF